VAELGHNVARITVAENSEARDVFLGHAGAVRKRGC